MSIKHVTLFGTFWDPLVPLFACVTSDLLLYLLLTGNY